MKNTFSWIIWGGFTVTLLLTTRNPIYLLLTICSLLFVGQSIAKEKNASFWLKGNIRFLVSMILISTIINTLFAHTGDSVLFSLPENWLLIGGNITIESFVYGAINGMLIGSLYLVFNVLNLALSIKQMTHLIPTTLRPIAMTVTVALTFFPSIQQRTREIKEAQMIRGNPMKRVVDWLPLVIPLLVTSLEKAFLLAESMTARGFHTQGESTAKEVQLIAMVLGTFAVFSGWILRLYNYPLSISVILYIIGGLIFSFVFIQAQRSNLTTRFHHEEWSWEDILLAGLSLLGLVLLLVLHFTQRLPSLSFSPYPSLMLPELQILGSLLALLPIIPRCITYD